MTAAHHASLSGHKDVIKYLMSNNAVLDAVDNEGRSALMRACQAGHMESVQMLLLASGPDFRPEINKRDTSGRTALDLAAENGNAEVVTYLLQHGASPQMIIAPDDGEPDRLSPLQVACTIGYEDTAAVLLRQPSSARPDQLLASGTSPFICACRNGHEGIINQMFAGWPDTDVNVADNTGRTPLSHAAGNGWVNVVKLLLDKKRLGCDIKDHHGRGAISYAAEKGRTKIAMLLLPRLEDGAVSERDDQGLTSMDYANKMEHWDLAEILEAWRLAETGAE